MLRPCPGSSMTGGRAKMEKSDEESGNKVWGGGSRERSADSMEESGGESGSGGGVDSQLWHACAGGMVQLPQVGSKVVYFPQGHAEHAASSPEFPLPLGISSTILCRVLSVKFLADTETDEVYARIRLQPELGFSAQSLTDDSSAPPPPTEKPNSFAKTLTQSDANNGGGFSVPRYCADTIFPRLDYTVDPPVQNVLAKDVHGQYWKFRHIYRGTPRRHLLTTGWSNFVNQKKLVAGDAIVFLRSAIGELCVGVRRSNRGAGGGDSAWHLPEASSAHRASRWGMKSSENSFDFLGATDSGVGGGVGLNRVARATTNSHSNFARNRARVTAKSVVEAATLAAAGQPFEIVYYPRATISEFCVKAHAVRSAMQQSWGAGMRFKMQFETDDSSRVSWFMGTISKVQQADPLLWPNSPWKMLQVTWDEPDLLQGVTRVSPWQVELVSPTQLPPFYMPKKKVRVSQPPELQLDGQGLMGLTMATFGNNVMGHMNPWHGFTDSVPAGMQGARHDGIYGLPLQDTRTNKIHTGLFLDNLYPHKERGGIGVARVPTELNVGDFTQDCPRVQNQISALLTAGDSSQSDPRSSNNKLSQNGRSGTKGTSFLLFGKVIDTTQSEKSQHFNHSGGNSSDGPGYDTVSDGNQSEVAEKVNRVNPGKGKECNPREISNLLFPLGGSLDSTSNGVDGLKWFKAQAGMLKREKGDGVIDDVFTHCKVFRENEEVGRTVDLSMFSSFEELYQRLAKMFCVDESEILDRVVYIDPEGFPRHGGDEPYRDFMRRAKSLKILSESSSESTTR